MKQCFSPIASKNAKILILGSMPGDLSLKKQQYYAHPRNAFWGIIQCYLGYSHLFNYEQQVEQIKKHGIALWDVMQSCKRQGSLDANIDNKSIVVNEFAEFFQRYSNISLLLFNGAKAELEYKKRVLPLLAKDLRQHELIRMPSTSPAMASLTMKQKQQIWSDVLRRFI